MIYIDHGPGKQNLKVPILLKFILLKLQCDVLTLSKSCVLTRVARRDWWASLKVVSVKRVLCFLLRTAFAKASGPSASRTDRRPSGGLIPAGISGGSTLTSEGGILVTIGVCGPFTSTFPK